MKLKQRPYNFDDWYREFSKNLEKYNGLEMQQTLFMAFIAGKNSNRLDAVVKPEIADIIKNIMQEGFDIAIGGNAFESEEWNKQWAEKKYDEAITKYTELICNQFSV